MSTAGDEPEKMQLASFGFAKSKPTRKVAVNVSEEQERRTLLTGVEGSKLQSEAGQDAAIAKQFVIARIENSYRTGVGSVEQQGNNRKFAPSFRPPTDDIPSLKAGEDRFVLAERAAPLITEYGLTSNTRVKQEGGGGDPQAGGSITARLTGQQLEDQAYKEDMAALPGEASLEEYEAMPVEEFGKAMLRGMGWSEGMGVGRKKTVVDAIEYVRRPERLGLGAQPAPAAAEAKARVVRMGDKPARADMVLAPEADGRQRNVRRLDEKLVLRKDVAPGAQVGKGMRVMTGRHEGLECAVLALLDKEDGRSDRASVRLSLSNAVVEVRCRDLGELWQRPVSTAAQGEDGGRQKQTKTSDGNGREGNIQQQANGSSERDTRGDRLDEDGQRRPSTSQRRDVEDNTGDGHHHRNGSEPRKGQGRTNGESQRGTKRAAEGEMASSPAAEDDSRQQSRHHSKQKAQHRGSRDDGQDHRAEGARSGSRSEREGREAGACDREPESRQRKKQDSDREEGRSREDQASDRQQQPKRGSDANGSSRNGSGSGSSKRDGHGGSRIECWLVRNIRVRVVDKGLSGGRLYLRKGTVLEVHPGAVADVVLDGGGGLQHLPQASLETVVPREPGTALMVLRGESKGEHARLLQANATLGVAAVELVGDLSILRVMLEDIAQFVGDLDE